MNLERKSQSPLRKTGFPGRFAKLGSALPALLCYATMRYALLCLAAPPISGDDLLLYNPLG